jgi:hypothetical protein
VCGHARAARTGRTRRTEESTFFAHFRHVAVGDRLARAPGVVWFFEKDSALLICEIRRAADERQGYEFEIAEATGPKTQRFDSPSDLIANYLTEQARLIKDGWRPRADLQIVD